MDFQQKQIWLVNFDPSFGHEYQKLRPALIVQNDNYLLEGHLITVLPLTSKVDKKSALDIVIPKDTNNRLMTHSLIKLTQISSFDKRRFIKFIGICDDGIYEEVNSNLRLFLSL